MSSAGAPPGGVARTLRGVGGAIDADVSSTALRAAPAPLAWLVETAIGTVLILAVARVLAPEDPWLVQISPHPLLALAAIVAARHGNPAGLLAGVITALVHVLAQSVAAPATPLSRAFAAGDLSLATPLLCLVAGAGLGELVRATQRASEVLRVAMHRATRRAREAEAALAALATRYDAIERRLVEPAASVARLHRRAAELESLDAEAIYPALAALAGEELRAASCSAYVLEGDRLRGRAQWTSAAADPDPRSDPSDAADAPGALDALDPVDALDAGGVRAVPFERALAALAIERRRTASARDLDEADAGAASLAPAGLGALADQAASAASDPAMLAAPIVGPTGQPAGVLLVRGVPFAHLSSASERILEMIGDWGGRGLGQSRLVERLRTIDEATGAYTYAHLCERLVEELRRARRFEHPFSLVVASVWDPDRVARAQRVLLRRTLAQLLRGLVRTIDLVACDREPLGFAVALPETGAEGARALARRLAAEVQALALTPYADGAPLTLVLGHATLEEGMRGPTDLERAARAARRTAAQWCEADGGS